MTREFEEYKKESKKLMDFCRRMIDKRGKREEYEELEQPQGFQMYTCESKGKGRSPGKS